MDKVDFILGQRILLAVRILANTYDDQSTFKAYARETINRHIKFKMDPSLWNVSEITLLYIPNEILLFSLWKKKQSLSWSEIQDVKPSLASLTIK